MDKQEIYKKASEYAAKAWKQEENPNEYDNAREDFVNGALHVLKQGSKLPMHDVSCCDFALWLQDNYSTNKKQGETEQLPKGYWRKDFTNEHYSIAELIAIYNRSCS